MCIFVSSWSWKYHAVSGCKGTNIFSNIIITRYTNLQTHHDFKDK